MLSRFACRVSWYAIAVANGLACEVGALRARWCLAHDGGRTLPLVRKASTR